MTRKRIDDHSTEFGLWFRNQKPDRSSLGRDPDPVDSSFGFINTNIDYVWKNYKSGKWMMIEEKRHGQKIEFWQEEIFKILDLLSNFDNNYCGFYLIVFENTNPEDGKIFIKKIGEKNYKEINREKLLSFLCNFEL